MDVNDHVALNIPQHRDVKLNELPKQIFMLLPLLLHWLYFSILWGGHAPQNGMTAAGNTPNSLFFDNLLV